MIDASEFDLRRACIHEAAHVVVAALYGADAGAAVWPSGAADVEADRLWLGRCWLGGPLAGEAAVIVGLAGEVACMVFSDPDIQAPDLVDYFDMFPDALSGTDRRLCDGFTEGHAQRCLESVRRHWGEIVQEADRLAYAARKLANE